MKIAIVRGAFLNKFEMQNYEPLAKKHKITCFSSLKPIHSNLKFPVVKLFSPLDLPNFPYKMPILNRIFKDAMYLWGLEKKLAGFDIAHSAETYYHYTQQCLEAKRRGLVRKVVVTVWEVIPFNNEGIWGRKEFKQRAFREVDKFLAVTNKAKEVLIKEGCPAKKIKVIYMGVDLQEFRMKDNKNKNSIDLLFVGRLVKEKGIYDLLKAFIRLLKDKQKVKLTIVGDGPEKESIINLIKQTNWQRFIKIKKVSYKKMPQVYQEADIFVLPSRPTKYWQEQFGMVLAEAMASGLTIISTKTGAIPEVVGKAGLLIKPGDEEELYRSLKILLTNRTKRLELDRQARKRAETFFDCRKTVLKIESLWKETLRQ